MKRKNLTEKQKQQAEKVFALVESNYGFTKEQILNKSRRREIVSVRAAIIYAYIKYGFTLTQVGAIFDKDHTTILNARRIFENMIFSSRHNDEEREYILLSKLVYGFIVKDCTLPLNKVGLIVVARDMTAKGSSLNAILGVLNN